MRIKKETYKIFTSEGWKCYSGSVGYDYPFMCHRGEGESYWRISHMACGYSVKTGIAKLWQAREIIEKLKAFPMFLMPTMETIKRQQDLMKQNNPDEYDKILAAINGKYKKNT